MKNRIVGWLKVDNCVPLTKAFDVRIDFSERFSNIHWQDVEKTFIKCDLDGYVKNPFNYESLSYSFSCLFDMFFKIYAVNIKEYFSKRKHSMFDNKIIMTIKDEYEEQAQQPIGFNDHEFFGQFVIIDNSYVYFSCTSHDFYEPINDFVVGVLQERYGNLGGWLVKLGAYEEIDSLLKGAI